METSLQPRQNLLRPRPLRRPASPGGPREGQDLQGFGDPAPIAQAMPDGHWTPYDPETPTGADWQTRSRGATPCPCWPNRSWAHGFCGLKSGMPTPISRTPTGFIRAIRSFITKPQVVSEVTPLGNEPVGVTEKTPGRRSRVRHGPLEAESPQPPINAYDVYCSGFITKTFRRPHMTILSSQRAETVGWAKGDVVYLNEGKAEGIEPGPSYQILRIGQKVSHPTTGRELGQYVRRIGAAKILAIQEHSSIAEITESCDEITVGNVLVPWVAIPIPWDVKRSAELPLQLDDQAGKVRGRVVWSEDRLEASGEHSVIYVDLGSRDQLIPGDKVWIFHYPAAQASLTEASHDLYRQQKIDVGPGTCSGPPSRSSTRLTPRSARAVMPK